MMFHYAVLQALGPEELFRLMRVAPDGSALPPRGKYPQRADTGQVSSWTLPLQDDETAPQAQ